MLLRLSEIEEFKGLWTGLEEFSTGLHLLKDVANHGQDLNEILKLLKDHALTIVMIKKLHGLLVLKNKAPTEFKATTNTLKLRDNIDFTATLDTAAPEDVEPLITKLLDWLDEAMQTKQNHPLLVVSIFSAIFLQISPFETGNQSLLRHLILILMLKSGYTYAPYVHLDPLLESNAKIFYDSLKHNQQSLEAGIPDWSKWIDFFLLLLCEQKDILKIRFENKEDNLSHLPTLSSKIMKLFDGHKRLQMKQIITLTRGRRSTIKLRIGELVEQGYLKRHGKARSTWYSLV